MKNSHEGTKPRRKAKNRDDRFQADDGSGTCSMKHSESPLRAFVSSCETKNLTPKLRFPEFRDAPGWASVPLKQVADINPSGNELPASFIYIDLESVEAGELKARNRISRQGAPSRAQRLLRNGDVIFQTVRPYQKNNLFCVCEKTEDYVASTGYAQLRARQSDRFLYHAVHNDDFVSAVMAKCTGSNYPAINSADLAEIDIAVPSSLPEQQKIASCLSSLDDLIAAERQKLDTLKAHKKGLMQHLFPREDEILPRLRFPEFRDAGEWTSVPLRTLLSREPEYGVSEPAVPYSEHLPTYLRITDIDDDGRFISETKTSVGINATDEQCLCIGDIALARTGASVGKSYLHRAGGERLVFAGFLIRIRPNPDALTPSFLSSFLSTSRYWDWVRVTSTRSGQPGLNGSEYASLQVPIPPEGKDGLLEQQRISSCLSSLDDLIAAKNDKIETLTTHKNGLMQQLFPSAPETEA